jgi:hypothetical protein
VYEHPCCVPGALRVCVCDVCVREVCWGGVDVGRWLPGVPALVTVPMRGWKKRERERERERERSRQTESLRTTLAVPGYSTAEEENGGISSHLTLATAHAYP